MLVLGKALSGGAYPVSAVLADDEVRRFFYCLIFYIIFESARASAQPRAAARVGAPTSEQVLLDFFSFSKKKKKQFV